MARPTKKSIDYFPLDCTPNDSIKYVEAKHGIMGYAILVKLWSKIYSSDGYFCYWNDKAKYLFCKENSIEVKECEEVLNTCLSEKIFDQNKLSKFKILTSIGIQKRYFKIIKESRRKDIEIVLDFCIKGVNTYINSVNAGINSVNAGIIPEETQQRKLNKIKLNKTKEKGKEKPLSNSELEFEDLNSNSEKEKSSAKKEKPLIGNCQKHFLDCAVGYYWEEQDTKALEQLLEKIQHSTGANLNDEEIEQNFRLFIEHLPKYWRTKKFTLAQLNKNFNEIINEIKTKNNGESTNEKFGRHSIDDLADRASTFGR